MCVNKEKKRGEPARKFWKRGDVSLSEQIKQLAVRLLIVCINCVIKTLFLIVCKTVLRYLFSHYDLFHI